MHFVEHNPLRSIPTVMFKNFFCTHFRVFIHTMKNAHLKKIMNQWDNWIFTISLSFERWAVGPHLLLSDSSKAQTCFSHPIFFSTFEKRLLLKVRPRFVVGLRLEVHLTFKQTPVVKTPSARGPMQTSHHDLEIVFWSRARVYKTWG